MTEDRVVVLGSANADLVVEVDRRPGGGETLLGSDLRVYAGGKGANQAVAAARAGARTSFIGCVGADRHGLLLRDSLIEAGIDVDALDTSPRPTGTAMILVTPDGENSIVVSPGANSAVGIDMIDRTEVVWRSAAVLAISMEIPYETVRYAVGGCRGRRRTGAAERRARAPPRRRPPAPM